MNQQEAEKILTETFNKEFNPDKFISFLRELLKGKLSINPKSSSPHREFEEYIKSFKKIGEYKNGRNNIEILIVELKKTSSLERARTMQRNFIAKWLNSDYSPKDGALVAFYETNLEDWRFSFVKMDYKFGEDGQVIKELTPAKRYSFLVGKNEPNHTCKKQFLNLLKEEAIPPTLEELEKAFSVDNVTKEFFDQYKERFIQLKESVDEIIKKNSVVRKEFEFKGINTIEFSKKLLGQIVFLYFLQKKGWLGVQKDNEGKLNEWGSGPKDFMKKLFNKEIVPYDNFFNDVLEPLFYQALANDRSADNDYYAKLKCKVPFLNGGLFEPIKDYEWTDTDILIDNNIFKDIFTTFDQFNFTIKEDEPLEREVAVDPEMLGKVFENLLDVNDRKSKGAFYTPREIVHYMCQQSLINYLETNTSESGIKREDIELFILKGDIALDRLRRIQLGKWEDARLVLPKSIANNYQELDKLLKEIKICDPAVGSGAFPVGMMNEIVRARNILTYFFPEKDKKERTDYHLKRQTIENSLYGVDIESSAVEITKLRFWLSLIVDELDMKNIRPLPNLDNRIMCGNSLIEEFEGVKLFDESLANGKTSKQMTLFKKGSDYKLETLQKLQSVYFNEQDRNKKKRLMKDIENLEWEFIEATLKEQGNEEAMKKLEQYKNSKSKPFFLWKLYFSDVFQRDNPGFDVVIANPPYLEFDEIRLKDQNFIFYRDNYQMKYKFNLYSLFLKKGPFLLRKGGVMSYIVPNSFSKEKYNEDIREDYISNRAVLFFVDFSQEKKPVFENASNDSYIVFGIKNSSNQNQVITVDKYLNKDFSFSHRIEQESLLNSFDYQFNISKNQDFLKKLESNCIGLGKLCMIRVGLTPSKYYKKKYGEDYKNFKKKYSKENNLFNFLKKNKEGDICERYKIEYHTDHLIWDRDALYKDKVCPGEFEDYYNPKLIFRNRGIYLYGSFDKDHLFVNDIFNVIVLKSSYKKDRIGEFPKEEINLASKFSLKYILSIINSKLIWFYLNNKFVYRDIKSPMMKIFPIKNISEKEQKPFIEIIDKILSITSDEDYLKNQDKQLMVKA